MNVLKHVEMFQSHEVNQVKAGVGDVSRRGDSKGIRDDA